MFAKYYEYCSKVEIPKALKSLARPRKASRRTYDLYRRIQSRFVLRDETYRISSRDALVRSLVICYRDYYQTSLLQVRKEPRFRKDLLKSLNDVCLSYGLVKGTSTFGKIEKVLTHELQKRGFYALFGEVLPFRSLMLWQKQTEQTYTVDLIDVKERVRVVFLDKFVEFGWMHFATFGKRFVGGWATKEALYCVKPAYDLKTDKFTASFLAHEARHFSDYKRFPKLQATKLEYRAKLSEIVAAKNPNRILRKFKVEQSKDKGLPHCYSAFKIVADLKGCSSRQQLRKHARTLLGIS